MTEFLDFLSGLGFWQTLIFYIVAFAIFLVLFPTIMRIIVAALVIGLVLVLIALGICSIPFIFLYNMIFPNAQLDYLEVSYADNKAKCRRAAKRASRKASRTIITKNHTESSSNGIVTENTTTTTQLNSDGIITKRTTTTTKKGENKNQDSEDFGNWS